MPVNPLFVYNRTGTAAQSLPADDPEALWDFPPEDLSPLPKPAPAQIGFFDPMKKWFQSPPPPSNEPSQTVPDEPPASFWEFITKPISTIPSQITQKYVRPITDWGMAHTGPLATAAKYGGAWGENVGDVASSLTSPLNLAMTVGTGGASYAAKAGLPKVAQILELPARAFAAGMVGEGGEKVLTGKDTETKLLGGVEGLMGLFGLRSGVREPRFKTREEYEAWKTQKTAPKPTIYEVVPTARQGEGTGSLTGDKIKGPTRTTGAVSVGGKRGAVKPPAPIPATGVKITPPSAEPTGTPTGVPYGGLPAEASGRVQKVIAKDVAAQAKADKALAQRMAKVQKAENIQDYMAALEGATPDELQAIKAQAGRFRTAKVQQAIDEMNATAAEREALGQPATAIPPTTQIPPVEPIRPIEPITPPAAPAKLSVTSPELETNIKALADKLRSMGREDLAGKVESNLPGIAAQVAPEVPTTSLENLFQIKKSPVDVAGEAYRGARAEQGINPLAKKQLGVALQREASKAGLPTKGPGNLEKFLQNEVSPQISEKLGTKPIAPAEAAPDWVNEQMSFIDRLKQLPREKGEIDPYLMSRIALGGGLGAYGAASGNTPEERVRRAIGFGLLGALAPSVVKLGPKAALEQAWQNVPKVQRFNYLASLPGLFRNAFVGPFGSVFNAGVERALMGDTRGLEALKLLFNPAHVARSIRKEFPEALTKIGRAEGHPVDPQTPLLSPERALAIPGQLMTTGDLVGGIDILQKVGFSEAEAREFMLTAEPDMLKWLSSIGKAGSGKSPNILAETSFPFKRTLANWVEQGSIRLPVIGSIVRMLGKVPATGAGIKPIQIGPWTITPAVRQQIVQQLMDAGIIYGNEQLGEHLTPEQALVAQRIISNFFGVHGLGATGGLAWGAARRAGKDPASAVAFNVGRSFPLPSIEPVTEAIRYAGSKFDPNKLPRGAMPGFLKPGFLDVPSFLKPEDVQSPYFSSSVTGVQTPASAEGPANPDFWRKTWTR